MYSFEGDFRSRPQQSLGGASRKVARDDLLKQLAEQRKNREDSRKKLLSIINIQAFVRGTLSRIHTKSVERVNFDELQQRIEKSDDLADDLGLLSQLLQKLLFFYSPSVDSKRLAWLSKIYLRKSHVIANMVSLPTNEQCSRVIKLLQLNIDSLVSTIESIPIAVPLRLLEVFTDPATYSKASSQPNRIAEVLENLWLCLIRKGYYRHVRTVLEQKVPDPVDPSPRPPTALAQSLFNLLIRPLTLNGTVMFRVTILRALFSDIFSEPLSQQIFNFLLPALSVRNDLLPVSHLLGALNDSGSYNRRQTCQLAIRPTIWLLYSFLTLTKGQISLLNGELVVDYLQALQSLVPTILVANEQKEATNLGDESDSEEAVEMMETDCDLKYAVDESVNFLNEVSVVNAFTLAIEDSSLCSQNLISLCSICYSLLANHRLALHRYRLLYTLAFKTSFLRLLWQSIQNATTVSIVGTPVPLLQVISSGMQLSSEDRDWFLPQLIVFCALFGHLLPTQHDDEFYGIDPGGGGIGLPIDPKLSIMPFTLRELAKMCLALRDVCLGWIDLAYPDARLVLNAEYKNAMQLSSRNLYSTNNSPNQQLDINMWLRVFKEVTGLLHQLFVRDSRRQFCPSDHWIAHHISMPVDKPCDLQLGSSRVKNFKPFIGVRSMTREQLEDEGPPISIMAIRYIKILQELPFVVSFPHRVKIFQALVVKDKQDNQGEMYNFLMGPQIQVLIRRNYIYEDAFDKLSFDNEPNLKLRMRVQLVNVVGLDEAGIDGGGIFREFLSELLKTAFDPNRGFFKTTHDRLLYPNPGVALLFDNYLKHYYFIGRMLGKAIYENMLVELPFAAFFLAKMLGKSSGDVDIHHLASLDPVMYRNLLYLKNYEGDVAELGLDFTVMNSELGENRTVELKNNGSSITVTASNRIEYIHLIADYKLNKQIRAQCAAFKQGLANVIDLEWIRMFDPKELQVLISGAYTPVDVQDLKQHTNYAGGYTVDHSVIKMFWKVVEDFTETQRRQLLKFVTSCSRPPLLGFKELAPAFCIQNAGSEPDRLPTASTCMNLLKLPEFQDEKTLRSKLLYAIESGAGFELS